MAKSSAPRLLLAALAWSGGAHAQRPDPQALVEAQRAQVRGMIRPSCNVDPDEITVCGRRDDRGPRGPLPAIPYTPDPGTIRAGARAGGEQREALANDQCIRLCSQPVQINIIGAIGRIGEAIGNLSDD
jgi:hypothetical protein